MAHVRRLAAACLMIAAVGCTPPIRQFDLKDQALTCEQANDYTYRTLQSMDFSISAFEPATIGHPGVLHAVREERRQRQAVTVTITCTGARATIDASEDGRWLGQLEFKRGFYLGFTATATQTALTESAARSDAERPLAQKTTKGLQVSLQPVKGLAAKLDFDVDAAAGGVLPIRVTINNASTRTYRLDPGDIVLVQADGTRVPPLSVDDAAARIAAAPHVAGDGAAALDTATVQSRLHDKLLTADTVASGQILKGYLFYPLAPYVKGRVSLEDQASEESEGFVVEF